jgi:hypothetical protein
LDGAFLFGVTYVIPRLPFLYSGPINQICIHALERFGFVADMMIVVAGIAKE